MPTTIEVVHLYFDTKTLYCGYALNSQLGKIRNTTTNTLNVTCFKCLNLLNIAERGKISRRKNRPIFRRLHIKRADTKDPTIFLAFCQNKVDVANLEHTQLSFCRTCLRNRKAK